MQLRRQVRGVVVPEQDVEGRRILAHQVVIHHIVPDKIIRTHPGKHACQIIAFKDAFASGIFPGDL